MKKENLFLLVSELKNKKSFSSFEELIKFVERLLNFYVFFPEHKKHENKKVILLHLPLKHFSKQFKRRKIKISDFIKASITGFIKNRKKIANIIEKEKENEKVIFQNKNVIIPLVSSKYPYCKKTYEKNQYACITNFNKIFPKMRLVAKTLYYKNIPEDKELIKNINFIKDNYDLVGFGKKSVVFTKNDKEHVIKLFEKSDYYEFLLEYIKSKKNLAFPAILKGPVSINEKYSVVVFEKTTVLEPEKKDKIIEDILTGHFEYEDSEKIFETLKELLFFSKIFKKRMLFDKIILMKNKEGNIVISDNIIQFPENTSRLP